MTLLCHSSYIGGSLFSLRWTPISAHLFAVQTDCGCVEECNISASLTSNWFQETLVYHVSRRSMHDVANMETRLTNAMCLFTNIGLLLYALKYEYCGRMHGFIIFVCRVHWFMGWHIVSSLSQLQDFPHLSSSTRCFIFHDLFSMFDFISQKDDDMRDELNVPWLACF